MAAGVKFDKSIWRTAGAVVYDGGRAVVDGDSLIIETFRWRPKVWRTFLVVSLAFAIGLSSLCAYIFFIRPENTDWILALPFATILILSLLPMAFFLSIVSTVLVAGKSGVLFRGSGCGGMAFSRRSRKPILPGEEIAGVAIQHVAKRRRYCLQCASSGAFIPSLHCSTKPPLRPSMSPR